MALLRHSVQCTRRAQHERVTRTPGAGQHDKVDDVRDDLDTGASGGNDKRRGGSGAAVGAQQLGVVGGHQHADEEDGQHVEASNTPKDALGGDGDVATGRLGLGSGLGDVLDATVGVDGVVEGGPEAEELAERAANVEVLDKGAGVAPVLEADDGVVGAAASDNDDGHEVHADDEEDLEGGKGKLHLAVDADKEQVGNDEQASVQDNPGGSSGPVVPKGHDDGGGSQLGRDGDEVAVDGVPSLSKGERGVDKVFGVTDDGTAERDEGAELGNGHDDADDETTDEEVTEQSTQWTALFDGASRTQKQTGTNCASEGNHLNMALSQSLSGDL